MKIVFNLLAIIGFALSIYQILNGEPDFEIRTSATLMLILATVIKD